MEASRFVDVWFDIDEAAVSRELRRLQRLALKVENTEVPNRQISAELTNFIFRNFQTEGGMTEVGYWAPLAESTVEWKEREGYSMILQNTGALRDSFAGFYDYKIAGTGAKQVFKQGRDPDLAAIHEFGSADGLIPSRPMLPNPRQTLAIAMRVYNLYIEEHTR